MDPFFPKPRETQVLWTLRDIPRRHQLLQPLGFLSQGLRKRGSFTRRKAARLACGGMGPVCRCEAKRSAGRSRAKSLSLSCQIRPNSSDHLRDTEQFRVNRSSLCSSLGLDAEDDIFCLAVSFLCVQSLRFSLSGVTGVILRYHRDPKRCQILRSKSFLSPRIPRRLEARGEGGDRKGIRDVDAKLVGARASGLGWPCDVRSTEHTEQCLM